MFERVRQRIDEEERILKEYKEPPLTFWEKLGVAFDRPVRRTTEVFHDGKFANWATYSVNPNYWNIVSTGDSRKESGKGFKDGLRTVRRAAKLQ